MLKSKVVRGIGLVALLLVAAWYASRHFNDLGQLRHFNRHYLVPLLLVHVATLGLNGWMNRELIARLGVKLPVLHWYGLAAVNALGNYLPLPQAGAAMRGAYLKRLHQLGYRRYAATVLFMYVLSLVIVGLAGLAALVELRSRGGRAAWWAWGVFWGLASLALLLVPGAARLVPGKRLAEFAEGYRALAHGGLIARMVVARVVLIGVNASGIWLAYHSIGRPVGWVSSLVVSLATMASGVVNVTPGNTGTSEAAAYGAAAAIGEDRATAVNAALVFRLTAAVVVFTLGPLFIALLRPKGQPEAHGAKAPVAPAAESL